MQNLGPVDLFDRTNYNCPFCGLNVSFGILLNGPEEMRGSEVVLHDREPCPTFLSYLDPIQFLQVSLNELKKRQMKV